VQCLECLYWCPTYTAYRTEPRAMTVWRTIVTAKNSVLLPTHNVHSPQWEGADEQRRCAQ
jgi:hypothetical protein